ncbi:MAG: LytTR family DNA-binding domain-containing protein [bacterium]|nr:LytTR family DNA-binding domain-containing protein [bacterium]MCM1375986.1 LytTR family DNA-binding domain-containing protein [Muribaculum sp.]
MRIAVCDDEDIFVKKIDQCLWQQPDCVVECFVSPAALLEKYTAGERYDVLFLDILMPDIDGMELARKIRAFDANVILIFLTSCLEYAPSGYEVRAFRYLLKPVKQEDITRTMEEIRSQMADSHRILLETPEGSFLLYAHELQYLEANNKDSILHYQGDTITLRRGLSELEEILPPLFFRIHRKFLINLSHVREYDAARLTLDCGQTLPISRRKNMAFRLALKNFIEGETTL